MKLSMIMKKIKENLLFIITIICAITVHFFMLDKIPGGWNVDEAGTAYDAWCIANYGVDRYRYSYPVYFVNFGGGQSAMYTYMTAVLIKLFGLSHYIVRIPSAIMSLMVLFGGIGFLRIVGADRNTKLTWGILYTILPYFVMAGRLGLDCNLMLGTTTIFMMCLAYALKDGKLRYFFLSGIACGIVLYTYVLSYLAMILFLGLLFILLVYTRKLTLKQVLSFCIPHAVIAAPLIFVQLINIMDKETITIWKFTFVKLNYRISELSFPKLSRLPSVFKAIFMYDWLGFSTNSKYYTLYWISIPFFAIGFVKGVILFAKNVRRRNFDACDIILIWFIAEVIVGTMIGGAGPTAYKLNGIFFSVLFYIVKGIIIILNVVRHKKIATMAIVLVYALFSASFFKYYFTYEKDMRHRFMSDTYAEVVEFIESNSYLDNKRVYVGITEQSYIYYLLSSMPSPYDITIDGSCIGRYEFGLPDNPQYDACYLLFKPDWQYREKLYPLGLSIKEYDNGKVLMYPKN